MRKELMFKSIEKGKTHLVSDDQNYGSEAI